MGGIEYGEFHIFSIHKVFVLSKRVTHAAFHFPISIHLGMYDL